MTKNSYTTNDNIELRTVDELGLQLEVAGIGARSYAFIIDWHIRLLLVLAWIIIAGFLFALTNDLSFGIFVRDLFDNNVSNKILFLFTVPLMSLYFLYHLIIEMYLKGSTPGKKMAGIRIVTESGQTPTSSALFIRNVFRVVDSFPAFYVIGLFTCFISDKQRRFGDMAAGTLLVYDKKANTKETNSITSLVGEQQISIEDWEIAHELLERWPELDASVSTELATLLLEKLGEPISPNNDRKLNIELRKLLEEIVSA